MTPPPPPTAHIPPLESGSAEGMNSAEAEAILSELAAIYVPGFRAADQPEETLQFGRADGRLLSSLEAKYEALLEQIPAVVFMAFLDRGIGEAYVNPQIERLLGFSKEEWLEDPLRWYQQVHPDDKQRWSIEAAEMFLSGKPLRSAYRVMARDGKVIWFQCEAKMVRHQDGRPWFIHGVGFDITELKRTEGALQSERNFVSAILDTVGALVVVLDPAGRIIRFNRAAEELTGYSFAEVKDKHVWDLFMVPEEVERFKLILGQLQPDNFRNEYENFWTTRQGGRHLIAWSSTVLTAANGLPGYLILTGIDITERKRLERLELERQVAKTEETEDLLRRLIDSMSEALFLVDPSGHVSRTNRAADTFLGRDHNQTVGTPISRVLGNPEIPSTAVELLQRAADGRLYIETELRSAAAQAIPVSVSCVLVRDKHDKVIGHLLVIQNITERKQAEAALRRSEKLAATGRLAASIAHEINNPLESITNLLYLAQHKPARAGQYLKLAEQELGRVTHITKQTLGFYRDTSSPARINLSKTLDDILLLYVRKLENYGTKIVRQYDRDAEVWGFGGEIRQVFSNITLNAIDAMSKGGILTLRVARSRHWNDLSLSGVRVTVADTGAGIRSKHLKRIFEPFFTTKKDLGTGLGLWLTQNIVHKHGGSIRVRSTTGPGKTGTVFSIFLPESSPQSAAAASDDSSEMR